MTKTIDMQEIGGLGAGWNLDFEKSKMVPAPIETSRVLLWAETPLPKETWRPMLYETSYHYTGHIALIRDQIWHWADGDYTAHYRLNIEKTSIKKIEEIGRSELLSITFDTPVGYSLLAGKRLGDLIENGDTIMGSHLDDRYKLTAKSEIVKAGQGDDVVDGRAGNDRLYGADDNDTLIGGAGADRLDGGSFLDTASYAGAAKGVRVSLANPAVNTNDAKGDVYISIENLTGTSHADKLYGDRGANTLSGGEGNDILKGGPGFGSDKLHGGAGADDLYGGKGHDVFQFKALSDSTVSRAGRDTIFDFYGDDQIDLSKIDASTKSAGNQAFQFIATEAFHGKTGELRYYRHSSDTYVVGDVNGDKKPDFTIHLDDRLTLDKYDFVF